MHAAAAPETTPAPNPVRQLVKWGLMRALPARLFAAKRGQESGAVFLTFDDGPHPEHTPRLLDVLAELGAHATFFVIGERAERHPDLVARIAREGHALGHHSFFHTDPETTSARQLSAEARRTSALLEGISGRTPTLFRPPHGKLTAGKLLGLWSARQSVVLWNVDPKDYACESAAELRTWFDARPLAAGDIVLLHDVWPWAAEVLPDLAAQARARGLALSALPPRITR